MMIFSKRFITSNEKGHVLMCSSGARAMSKPVRGFTLVETLVAITVVTTAIVGPLYAVQQSLNASRSAKDQLIASSLAQEGVEFARYVRDSNYLYVLRNPGSNISWLYGIDGTGDSTNCFTADCVVDPVYGSVSNTIQPLYINSSGIYTQQQNGTPSLFTRTIRFAAVSGSTTEVIATVTVTWTYKGTTRSVVIREHLHNWL